MQRNDIMYANKLVEEITTTMYLYLCLSMGVTLGTSWKLHIRNNKIEH